MIRKTVRAYVRYVKSYDKNYLVDSDMKWVGETDIIKTGTLQTRHREKVQKITYWFLFIPVYSKEKILYTEI